MINWRKSLYVILDSIFLNAATITTFYLRYGGEVPQVNYQAYIDISLITTIIGIASLYFNNLYDYDRKNSYIDILYSVARAVVIGIIIMVAFIFYARSFAFPRTVIMLSIIVNIVFLCAWRFFEKAFAARELSPLKTLIVGTSSEGILIKNDIETYSNNMHEIAGYLDDTPENGMTVLGGFSDIEKVIEENKIDLVIVSSEKISLSKLIDLIFRCDGVNVKVAILPNLYEIVIGRVDIKQIAGIPLLEVNFGAYDKLYERLKNIFDFSFAIAGLIALSPFFIIVPLLIKLESNGPAIYSQTRVGRNEKEFKIFKFRTMVKDAEAGTGPVLSSGPADGRVTALGRFLRKYHIDEFPQLINVIKGEMSVVGPRPERPHFVERFCKMLPVYSKRFLVKPGITGLAQVHGRYDSNFEHKLRYDLAYINNMSLLLDFKIIILTIYSNFIKQPKNVNS